MRVRVVASVPECEAEARQLAAQLGLERERSWDGASGAGPAAVAGCGNDSAELLLVRTPERLELREAAGNTVSWGGAGEGGGVLGGTRADGHGSGSGGRPGRRPTEAVHVEFVPGHAPGGLLRALLVNRGVSRVVDATAGLGQDAFALAEAGCRVEMIERSPVVAALLRDGLGRALRNPDSAAAAGRLVLHEGEATALLPQLAPVEVVYLDPMYPRSGREGRKVKGMRLLRELLGGDEDAGELLTVARAAAGRRVVVKRPRRAPWLAGVAPSGSQAGKTVRYDLYPPAT